MRLTLIVSCGRRDLQKSKMHGVLMNAVRALQQHKTNGANDYHSEEESILYAYSTPVRTGALLLNCFIDASGDQETINSLIRFLSGFKLDNGTLTL